MYIIVFIIAYFILIKTFSYFLPYAYIYTHTHTSQDRESKSNMHLSFHHNIRGKKLTRNNFSKGKYLYFTVYN